MFFQPVFHIREYLLALRVIKDFMVETFVIFQRFVFELTPSNNILLLAGSDKRSAEPCIISIGKVIFDI